MRRGNHMATRNNGEVRRAAEYIIWKIVSIPMKIKSMIGTILVIIGLIGIAVPVMPGWSLLFVGLLLTRNRRIRGYARRAKARIMERLKCRK